MPIDLEAFAYPEFFRYKQPQPLIPDKKARYYNTTTTTDFRQYREGYFPQQGYNPHLNQARPRKININNETYTLPPY